MKAETLNKINDALARLEEGDYGNCFECGEEIAEKRLRALPFAVRCKDCEEAREVAAKRERHARTAARRRRSSSTCSSRRLACTASGLRSARARSPLCFCTVDCSRFSDRQEVAMSDQHEGLELRGSADRRSAAPIPPELPILPLRDTVLFPNSFMPLAVARESSVRLIDDAIANGKLIAVFTQRDAAVEEPTQADLYPVGTATHIHKMFKLPDGSLRLIVQGLARLQLERGAVDAARTCAARVTAAVEALKDERPPRDRRARSATSRRISSRSCRCRRCCPTICRRSR